MIFIQNFLSQTWLMIAEMGTFLLLGFAISVALHRLLKQAWVERLMGRRSLSSIVWGSIVGVPMPLCSCGVIPVTMSLRAKGASNGAAVSFLTSTPQTGADSFLATYAMLGPVFAIYKIVVAFLSGIAIGFAVDRFDKSPPPAPPAEIPVPPTGAQRVSQPQPTWPESARYGFVTMPADLSGSLLLGFLLAGLIAALAPENLLANIPGGALSAVLLATVISVPFYICSTGSIPLALALVHSGLPISAALVLLIAGPATNIATISAMRKILGGRATLFYVVGVILTTWIAAGFYQLFLGNSDLGQHTMNHVMELPLWKHVGGALLLALLIVPKLLTFFKPETVHTPVMTAEPNLKTATLKVAGMNCSHCENSVKNGLSSLAFQPTILSVDRQSETAVIQAREIDEAAIREKLEELGFEYKGAEVA